MPLSKFKSLHRIYDYTTEESTNIALINLSFFLLYLIGVTAIGESLTSEHTYLFSRDMELMFKRTYYNRKSSYIDLDKVITINDFWDYMQHVVMQIFHGTVYDETTPWRPHMISYRPCLYGREFLNESILLGPPRLRQIRVRNQTCSMNYAFLRYFNNCVGEYSSSSVETTPIYKGTKYGTFNELSLMPLRGPSDTYYHGGYVQMLTYKAQVNRGIIRHLRKIDWFDRRTRLIVLEFNLLNLNFNLYQSIKLIFEVPPSGLINSQYSSNIMGTQLLFKSLNPYLSSCILMAYTINLYFTYVEIKKIHASGFCNYFKDKSILLPLPRIIIIYLSMLYTIYFQINLVTLRRRISVSKDAYISIDRILYIYGMHRIAIGILICFSWVGLLTFMDFNPVLRTIGHAIRIASVDLYAFSIMFLILFTAYGNLGLLLFGGENEHFRNFFISVLTMMNIFAGQFDYFALEEAFHITGPIYFMTYILLIFFVLEKMFLAVIVLSYRTAMSSTRFKPNFLWYVLRKHLYRISNGLIQAPEYPSLSAGNQTENSIRLTQLQMYMDYTELEYDINRLTNRLDIIENIFYRLTNRLEDIIALVKKNDKRRQKS